MGLAQGMYRAEVNLRTSLLGEPAKHIRPLSETKAIENGANALAEGFLFGVAALLIVSETWRSSRSSSKRRDSVDEQLEELRTKITALSEKMDNATKDYSEERQRNDELTRILERIVEIGLRGGWAEFENTPLAIPRIELVSPSQRSRAQSASSSSSTSTPSEPPSQGGGPSEASPS